MSMIKCPECGKEISDLAEKCPNCGFPIGFESTPVTPTNTYNIPNNTPYQSSSPYQTQQSSPQLRTYVPKQKNSGLGIASLILSILGCTFIVGVILAIVDLCRKDNNKKTCSIIALCICGFWLIAGIAGTAGKDSESENIENTTQITMENIEDKSNNNLIESEESEQPEQPENQEEKSIDTSSEYINITSTELIDAYNDNQVKCKQTYDGKLLCVTGEVSSIGTDIVGNTYVCLGHDTEFTFVGIQCYTKDNNVINEIAELKEGDVITVSGKGECGSLSFSLKNMQIIEVLESVEETYVDENGSEIDEITTGQKNALNSAKSYLDFSAFSYQGLIDQLEYEKYSHEDAVFAADNCGADWNEQAVRSAKSYLEFSSFSKDGLIEQLEYEGFTHEQAVHGAEANGY